MFKLLILIVLFVTTNLNAEVVVNTSVKNIEGTGVGTTRATAVNNAIAEAIGQINGVRMTQEKFISDTSIETSSGDTSAYVYNNKIKSITKGKVDSFNIIEVNKYSDHEYEAIVEVTKTIVTKEYKTPGHSPNKRRKLAIVPSYSNGTNFTVLGSYRSSREVTQRLTQELVSSVTQTRKFTMLDRENNDAYNMEKSVILSRDAHEDEILKLGNVLGADYLLVSNLTEFKIYNDVTVSNLTGRKTNNLTAYATVQYRILAMATKQIKWSNTTTFEFEPDGNTNEQVFLNALKKISGDLTYEIIENIFPIKITDISSDGIAILNQSSALGETYDVYKLGKRLYDNYTKEFLGRDEIKIGTIQVSRVLPKISYAKTLEGSIEKGAVCRKVKIYSQEEVSDEEIGTEAGFSL